MLNNPFIEIINNIDKLREDYEDHPGLNNSTLSIFEESPKLFEKVYITKTINRNSDKSYYRFGSLVDCLITLPDTFYDKYIIAPRTAPTGQIMEFINELSRDNFLFKEGLDKETIMINIGLDNMVSTESLNYAYYKVGIKGSKLETIIEKVKLSDNINYLKFLLQAKGKIVISNDDYRLANKIKQSCLDLESNPKTTKWVKPNEADIVINQCPLYTTDVFGNSKKGLLDQLLIFHKDKKIIIKDYKTTGGGIGKFNESFSKYRYGRQITYYYTLVKELIANTDLSDYEVRCFIVPLDKKEPFDVMPFEVQFDIIASELRNIQVLLENLKKCKEQNEFTYPEYKVFGLLTLNTKNVPGYE